MFWAIGNWWVWILVGLIYIVYRWSVASYGHFKNHGVPHRDPWPFVGNMGAVALRRQTVLEVVAEAYTEFKRFK